MGKTPQWDDPELLELIAPRPDAEEPVEPETGKQESVQDEDPDFDPTEEEYPPLLDEVAVDLEAYLRDNYRNRHLYEDEYDEFDIDSDGFPRVRPEDRIPKDAPDPPKPQDESDRIGWRGWMIIAGILAVPTIFGWWAFLTPLLIFALMIYLNVTCGSTRNWDEGMDEPE